MEDAEIFEHLGGKAQSLWFCVCNFSLSFGAVMPGCFTESQ